MAAPPRLLASRIRLLWPTRLAPTGCSVVEESDALRRQLARAQVFEAVLHPLPETALVRVVAPRTWETSLPPHPIAELDRIALPRVAPRTPAAPPRDVLIKPGCAVSPKFAPMQMRSLLTQPKCEAALFEVVAGLPRERLRFALEVSQCHGADDPLAIPRRRVCLAIPAVTCPASRCVPESATRSRPAAQSAAVEPRSRGAPPLAESHQSSRTTRRHARGRAPTSTRCAPFTRG